MKKGNSNFDVAGAYNSPAAADPSQGAGGSFADSYDSAQAPEGSPGEEGAESPDQEAAEGLDIPEADVEKMQALKDSGDMAGLGKYVSQFLK
jgi:hypothetical protein